jgi:glycosyltransferase involved in cell wall biosynthesis
MVKIGFDVSGLDPSFKAHFGRGIGRYVSELTKFYSSHTNNGVSVEQFDYKRFILPSVLENILKSFPVGRQTLRQQVVYPLQLSKMREFDLLHFPAHMDAPSWSRKPCIVTVLDLIPIVCRELYEKDRGTLRFKFARFLELQAIKRARHIIAISKCTADDLNRLLAVPYDKISVVPLGIDRHFFQNAGTEAKNQLLRKLNIQAGRPVLLYVGGIDQRKNISVLLRIFAETCRMRAAKKEPLPYLVIAGKIANDRQYPKLLEEREKSLHKDSIILAGYIPDSEITALFGITSVFVFPSLYEGFGLPPLEAMAAGVPVVSSNTSSMPEVLSDAALYFPPNSVEDAVKQIDLLLSNNELAKKMIELGKQQAQRFTWDRTGKLTLDVYRQVGESFA